MTDRGKVTERQMLDYLHKRYTQTNPGNGPRYACAEHVKDAAGFFHNRVADFIAAKMLAAAAKTDQAVTYG
ncbi:hypothetical protein PJN91_17265 [Mycobacterium kansasii]